MRDSVSDKRLDSWTDITFSCCVNPHNISICAEQEQFIAHGYTQLEIYEEYRCLAITEQYSTVIYKKD